MMKIIVIVITIVILIITIVIVAQLDFLGMVRCWLGKGSTKKKRFLSGIARIT